MIIGTCSICYGAVVAPDRWMGSGPAPKSCRDCGAVSSMPYGAIIEMVLGAKISDEAIAKKMALVPTP